ncbi:MAG: hypothetical protein JXB48_00900 [Candidatus Latescibacteria bacterium]|nr:hypothetical protein [Candidatus Latescibacterota bacterium]
MTVVVILSIHSNFFRQISAKSDLSAIQHNNVEGENITEYDSGIFFESEKIYINIQNDRVSVTGHYFFHNHDSGKRIIPLSYPFPVNEEMEFPDSISVYLSDDSSSISFEKNEKHGVVFFAVPVTGLTEFVVSYSQKLHGSTARYILTTTQTWKEPLKYAVFSISTPQNFKNLKFNYKPDLTKSEHDCILHIIERTDFMPDKDLYITW